MRLVSLSIILVATSILFFSQVTAAQNEVGPTDLELHAGYCLGYFQEGEPAVHKEYESTCINHQGDARACYYEKRLDDEQNSKIIRLRSYLIAKGYYTGREPLPITMAALRGKADYYRTLQIATTTPCPNCSAPSPSDPKSFDATMKCVNACFDAAEGTGAFGRIRSCQQFDAQLPF